MVRMPNRARLRGVERVRDRRAKLLPRTKDQAYVERLRAAGREQDAIEAGKR